MRHLSQSTFSEVAEERMYHTHIHQKLGGVIADGKGAVKLGKQRNIASFYRIFNF